MTATAAGQDANGHDKGAPDAAFDIPANVKPIRLTLSPTPAPVPALRYRLLPELRDLKSGNSAVLYYRAFAPEWQLFRDPKTAKILDQWGDDRRQPPPKELALVRTSAALKQLDYGARRTYVDWEMLDPLRREGISMLLGDIQGFRGFVGPLAARARFEMAEADFDKAVYSLQTGFKFGRDVGDGPTLIQALVGLAIINMISEQIEELIQTLGSPNLY